MCVSAGATVLRPLVGFLLQHYWAHQIIDNAPVYRLVTYQHALLVLPLVSLWGLL